jgi:PAS domain S-box-containing protein
MSPNELLAVGNNGGGEGGPERRLDEKFQELFWEAQTQQRRCPQLFEFSPDGFLTTDRQGIIHEANQAAAELLGTRKEFLIGKPLGLLLVDASRSHFYTQLVSLTWSATNVGHWEVRTAPHRAEPRDVALTAMVLTSEQGWPDRVYWLLRDISPMRKTERALVAERELSDHLVETAEIIILVVDIYGQIQRANPFLLRVSGFHPSELRDRNWCEALLPEADRDKGLRLMHQALFARVDKSGVLELMTHGPRRRFVTWTACKLQELVILVGYDVTELQEVQEQALRAARLAAVGQMSAGLAHESRNALQRMQSCLSILTIRLQGQPELLELLERMQRAQDDLQRQLEDVRTFATGPRLKLTPCDLARIWREAWAEIAATPLKVGAEIREDTLGVDLFLLADPFHLKQVFRNLLENALASGANPVRIVIRCRAVSLEGREALRVSVCDNGPGFPEASRCQLFEPFFTTKLHGTGLGLAICKRIVEAHGGRIELGAESCVGAEIIFTLPRRGT